MARSDATGGRYCGISNEDLAKKLKKDEKFRHSVVKAYFGDHIFGTKLKNDLGIKLSDLNEVLDDNPDIAKDFNDDLVNFASARIERNVNVGIAHLTEEITRNEDDINALRIIQSAIQTLSTIKKTFESRVSKQDKKLDEFENALHKLGL